MRKYILTRRFEKSLTDLPADIARLFEKKLGLFLEDIFHPSFRAKKIAGTKNPDIWEASLTMDYRFTFQIDKDGVLIFRNIGKHSILERKKV
ncbi:MAG: cytotoxin [Nitrospirae bacterium]|nr:cytotoxin [Nitrospirota bacterium]